LPKLGVGILGVGKLSCKTLIPAFKFCDEVKLVALGSRNPIRAKSKIKAKETDLFFGSYDEVLSHSEVQIVYIVLPNHLHAEWSIKAMNQGKAVLCEKPLCMNLLEMEKIKEASNATGQLFAEAFMYRFHPQHQKVKEILASGVLGELQLFRAQFSYFLDDPTNIRLKPDCGGGALRDVGCYLIDSLLWLSGKEVSSLVATKKVGETGTDESTCIQVDVSGGLKAQLFCSTRSSRENWYSLVGEFGSIDVPQAYIPASGKQVCLILKTPRGQEAIKVPGVNTYATQMDEFSKCVARGKDISIGDPLYFNEALHHSLHKII